MPVITDEIIAAVIAQESGGYDRAIGDKKLANKAFGPLQIRQPVCDDVNRVHGTKLRAEMMLGNRDLSIETFKNYIPIYVNKKRLKREPTTEDICRCWNGGPDGYKKPATVRYWTEIQRYL